MAAENWEDNPDLKKLYISKLTPGITYDRLVEYFGEHGEVTECKVVKDTQGNPRGFAFLTMSDQAAVDTILDHKPHTIDGQTVFLRRAIPKDDPNPLAQAITKKLFIGGLTEEATEQDITSVLSIFTSHQPEQIKLMRDRNTNKFKGYAFVIFESEDVVDKLFIIRNATIKAKRVELKKAEELGAPGAGGRGGGRGGGARGRGGARGGGSEFRGRGARGGGYGANQGGYSQSYDYSFAGYGGEYDGYGGSGGYDYNGYGSYSGGGGGGYSSGSYGGGSYGSGGYGGGYDMGSYRSEASGYGPNRRGRGRGGGGGGGSGYHPY